MPSPFLTPPEVTRFLDGRPAPADCPQQQAGEAMPCEDFEQELGGQPNTTKRFWKLPWQQH